MSGGEQVAAQPALERSLASGLAGADARQLTWQKLILGDWSRVVRDPLDVLRIVFIAATIVWGFAGGAVTQLVAAAGLLVLARLVNLPRFYDLSLIVALTLIAWGEVLGVYDSWAYYDNVVHFTVPLLVTGLIYVVLERLGVLPDLNELTQPHHLLGFFLNVLALGMAVGAGWEIVEWALDETTGSELVLGTTDTATDLIWDTMGAAVGALVLVLWSLGNHSLRRRSGAELADRGLRSLFEGSAAARPTDARRKEHT